MWKWLCGIRPAARAWGEDSATKLERVGLQRGKVAPTYFFDESSQTRVLAHGDDFEVAGPRGGVEQVKSYVKEWEEVDQTFIPDSWGMGPKGIVILGRIVRWRRDGVFLEADEKQGRLIWEAGTGPGGGG